MYAHVLGLQNPPPLPSLSDMRLAQDAETQLTERHRKRGADSRSEERRRTLGPQPAPGGAAFFFLQETSQLNMQACLIAGAQATCLSSLNTVRVALVCYLGCEIEADNN